MVLVIFREKSLVGQCMVWHPKDHWTLKTGHFEDPNPAIQVQTLPLKGPRSVGQLIFCWPPKKAHTIQRSKQRRYIRLEVEAGCIHPGRVTWLEPTAITHLERNMIFQTSMRTCSMLIFRGVFFVRVFSTEAYFSMSGLASEDSLPKQEEKVGVCLQSVETV